MVLINWLFTQNLTHKIIYNILTCTIFFNDTYDHRNVPRTFTVIILIIMPLDGGELKYIQNGF